MKINVNKLIAYAALVLISSLPISVDVLADLEKKQNFVTSESTPDESNAEKTLAESKRKISI